MPTHTSPVSRFSSFPEGLAGDFLDRGADRRQGGIERDAWAALAGVLAGVGALFGPVEKVGAQLIGSASAFVPALLLLAAIGWTLHLVRSKRLPPLKPGFVREPGGRPTYRYSQGVRHLAKGGLVVLVVAIPYQVRRFRDTVVPLPSTVYGIVRDLRSRDPIQNARVAARGPGGADITRGRWLTDNDGFFILAATRGLRRTDSLLLTLEACPSPVVLPLTAENELHGSRRGVAPVFQYWVTCPER